MAEQYRGFTLNEPFEEEPWGLRENSLLKSIIDRVLDKDPSIVEHNLLSGIQGGTQEERYHLTQEEKDGIGKVQAGAKRGVGFSDVSKMTVTWSEITEATSGQIGELKVVFTDTVTMKNMENEYVFYAGDERIATVVYSDLEINDATGFIFFGMDGKMFYSSEWLEDLPSMAVLIADLTGGKIASFCQVLPDYHNFDMSLSTRDYLNTHGAWFESDPYVYTGTGNFENSEAVLVNDDVKYVIPQANYGAMKVATLSIEDGNFKYSVGVERPLDNLFNATTGNFLYQVGTEGGVTIGELADHTKVPVYVLIARPDLRGMSDNAFVLIPTTELVPSAVSTFKDTVDRAKGMADSFSGFIDSYYSSFLFDWNVVGFVIPQYSSLEPYYTQIYKTSSQDIKDLEFGNYWLEFVDFSLLYDTGGSGLPPTFAVVNTVAELTEAFASTVVETILITNSDDSLFLSVSNAILGKDKIVYGDAFALQQGVTGLDSAPFELKVYCSSLIMPSSDFYVNGIMMYARNVRQQNGIHFIVHSTGGGFFKYERLSETSTNTITGLIKEFWDNTNTNTAGVISEGVLVQRNMYPSSIDQVLADANTIRFGIFTASTRMEVGSMSFMSNNDTGSDTVMLGVYNSDFVLLGQAVKNGSFAKGNVTIPLQSKIILEAGELYWLAYKSVYGAVTYGAKTTYANDQLCRAKWDGNTTDLPPAFNSTEMPSTDSKTPYISLRGDF